MPGIQHGDALHQVSHHVHTIKHILVLCTLVCIRIVIINGDVLGMRVQILPMYYDMLSGAPFLTVLLS